MKISNLRVNGIREPIGFDCSSLSLSWNVDETESREQINARIEVAADASFQRILFVKENPNLRQSGEPVSLSLLPRTRYYWRITVWGDLGDAASSSSWFFTGKLDETWKAFWIAAPKGASYHPVLSHRFCVKRPVREAVLHVTGVGMFEAFLNDDKIGNEFFTPYLTDYESEIQTFTYILDRLNQGINKLEILLGKGWYMGRYGLDGRENHYGSRMAGIAELHLEYEDGTSDLIITDEEWMVRPSDIVRSGIYDGECLDRLSDTGNSAPEEHAEIVEPEKEEESCNLRKDHLTDRFSLPLIVKEEVPVKEILHTPAGETVLDLGQNFTGYLEMKLEQPAGTKIRLSFGEILQQGCFYNGNYRGAKGGFEYRSDGRSETVRTHFSFWGFRYVLIEGFAGEPQKEDFIGKVLYSDLPRTGWFSCGNDRVNRLYENTLWSMKSNFLDIPTDCPQRDERLGWTGDAQVFSSTANYHMDTRAFFRKFLRDLRNEQKKTGGAVPDYFPNLGKNPNASSVWGDIATILPDHLYQAFGDLESLRETYPLMKEWVDWINRKDAERGTKYLYDFGFHYGDWLALDGATPSSCMGGTEEGYIGSAYYLNSCRLTAKAAALIGKQDEEKKYQMLAEKIHAALLKEYFTPTGRLAVPTQTGHLLAMRFGLYPDPEKGKREFQRRMKQDLYRIRGGFVGAPLMCSILAEQGMTELAYELLFHEGFPGWLYEVDHGATTIWERWNSVMEDGSMNPDGMNSLNHYAYGSVAEFLYRYSGGIRALKPGFTEALIEPEVDVRLGWCRTRYDSVNGTYSCEWKIETDGKFSVRIQIPFNCRARVRLPGYKEKEMILTAGKYEYSYVPIKDFRKAYSGKTTLERLLKDPRASAILKDLLPEVWHFAENGEENRTLMLAELCNMPFIPSDPEMFQEAIRRISDLNTLEAME